MLIFSVIYSNTAGWAAVVLLIKMAKQDSIIQLNSSPMLKEKLYNPLHFKYYYSVISSYPTG